MTTQQLNSSRLIPPPSFDSTEEATILLAAPAAAGAAPAPVRKTGTGRFEKQGWATVEELVGHPSGDGFPTGDFVLVPAHMAHKSFQPGTLRWWVELWADRGMVKPLRLEVVGDVVLGRSGTADVDLQPFGAMEHGISRRHAMLRPSRNALYLLDLGSTNGTHCNGIPMGQGIAMSVTEHAVLRLGTLNLSVRYLAMTTV